VFFLTQAVEKALIKRRTKQLVTKNATDIGFSFFFSCDSTAPRRPSPPHFRGFTITHIRHITLGRTPLDEGPARRRDLYLNNTQHSQETDINAQAGFEPTIPASERP
jgi:hypothetical protein